MRSDKYKITDEIKAEVKSYLKKEKNVVVKERLLAINMYMNGMTQEEVSRSLDRNRTFTGHAIRGYLKNGIEGIKERRGGNLKSRLSDEQKEELKYIIENTYPIEAKGWDGKIILELIKERYKVIYKIDAIYWVLKQLGITYKKAKKIDPKKSEKKIEDWKNDIKKTQ